MFTALPKGVGSQRSGETLNQGVNDFGHAYYDGPDGPCPPRGHGTHHYHFRLAAFDTSRLVVSPGAKVADIWRAAEPHILAQTELVGAYARWYRPLKQRPTMAGIPCCLARLHNETKPSTGASSQARLFDFADSFHDFGHGMVLLFRQLIDEVQDVPRGLVLSRIRFQIPLGGREFDPLQVMSELGG
jgi:hypothetical protein